MPDLREMLKQARKKDEAVKPKIIKGIRPDKILRGEINFTSEHKNVDRTQPERSQQPGQNVDKTEPKRSQDLKNVDRTQPERSQQPGQNVDKTEPKRSQEPGQNGAIKNATYPVESGNPTLLVGTQRKVFGYLFHLAQQYACLTTPRLTLETMTSATGLTEGQIHSATKQLRKKNCIKIADRKDGRGGWIEYAIIQGSFDTWFKLENSNKRSQNVDKTEPKRSQEPGRKPGHETLSSSSYIYNNKTTTEPPERDAEWQKISLGPSEEHGLSSYYIQRARELYPTLDPIAVQKLIYGFEKHLAVPENKKAIRNPGAFFLSLAEKVARSENPLPEYQTPDEELLEKLQAEAIKRRDRMTSRLKALQDDLFEIWWMGSEEEEKCRLVPSGVVRGEVYKTAVKSKWLEKVWPQTPEAAQIEASTWRT